VHLVGFYYKNILAISFEQGHETPRPRGMFESKLPE